MNFSRWRRAALTLASGLVEGDRPRNSFGSRGWSCGGCVLVDSVTAFARGSFEGEDAGDVAGACGFFEVGKRGGEGGIWYH